MMLISFLASSSLLDSLIRVLLFTNSAANYCSSHVFRLPTHLQTKIKENEIFIILLAVLYFFSTTNAQIAIIFFWFLTVLAAIGQTNLLKRMNKILE